jgi:preprotein translocase subunit SecA
MASSEIPLVGPLINRLFGTRNERVVKRYNQRVDAINALEDRSRALTDAELRAKTQEFRERHEKGEKNLMDEVFAVARETMDRAVGMRNMFNPEHREAFPVDKLPEDLQVLYRETMEKMDAAEPRSPEGDLLGCTEPQPGWVWMDIPNELYDAVRELYPRSKPPFRARPFDVQLIGAIVLYQGKIAEMKTGEGKTIVAPLASYLAMVEGKRVHVVTVNDYLVQRDRDWVFPFFRALGVTVGAIHPQHMQPEDVKRTMYACDAVYGTTSEFGFDYLRDNMKRSADQQVQRVREFAIVDEVDSTLIDEARTPLIISGPAHEDQPRYELADQLARHLVEKNKPWQKAEDAVEACKKAIKGKEGDIRNAREKDKVPQLEKELADLRATLPGLETERDQFTQFYEVKEERKSATLTHEGVTEAQKQAGLGSFYVGENTDVPHLLEQALRAHVIYERDVDYVVMPTPDPNTGRQDNDVVIVDTNTGRPMVGRQWSDGLHQAVQCKERLRIRPETQTVATITIQNFFKMYERLAGMTGTADTEAQEFMDIYKLDVVTIPTNVPVIRRDFDDTVYLTQKDKWDSIVEEIKNFHDMGRPVLVGTTSVEKSEMLSTLLTKRHGIKHEVLNAKQHEREASIVEGAGQLGAVMIATNMAGRGTDIRMARVSRQQVLDHWLRRGIAPRELTVEDSDEQVQAKIFRKVAVKELGLSKRDLEAMDDDEIEIRLLRKWATEHTWAEESRVQGWSADQCRAALNEQGRFGLHNIRWVDSVEELGGLHVIGTERHESRRIDNQLRGRSGRQGDRGSSRFFVSLDDELMKLFAGDTTLRILSRLGMKEGDAIEHPMLSKSIVRAQRKVEERNFQIRKQILEYDEVMEHQRQDFYGTRQRVIDGRDVRGLIFDNIEDATLAAIEKYLDKDYSAEQMALHATDVIGVSVPPERLRNKEKGEALDAIRNVAKSEASIEIDLTIGEYIPDAQAEVEDIDTGGLIHWAHERFGVELTTEEIYDTDLPTLKQRILDGAGRRIDEADLSGIDQYTVPHYGEKQLEQWLKKTVRIDIKLEEIVDAEDPQDLVDLVIDRVRKNYDRREIEHPVDFMMQMTMLRMRQDPKAAAAGLVAWANRRYDLGWDESVLRTRMPQQLREELLRASEEFMRSGKLEEAVREAQACTTEEELVRHFKEQYDVTLPVWLKRLRGKTRDNAVRARVESILRAELVMFEQTVMLQTIDPMWKDHLYDMERLRSSISYRAFSQKDPKIEFKREGARLFTEFKDSMRERVTEFVFNAQIQPQAAMGGPMQRPAPRQDAPAPQAQPPQHAGQPQQTPAAARLAGAAGGGFASGSISGPGLDTTGGSDK